MRRERSATEHLLATAWAEVLGVPEVGVDDDFFELAGDSIAAAKIVANIQTVWRVTLPLSTLVEAPTVAALAGIVEKAIRSALPPAPPLVHVEDRDGAPLAFQQLRMWYQVRRQPGLPDRNLPLAIRLRGPLSTPALVTSVEDVVARHDVLRTSFPAPAGTPVQRLARTRDFAVREIDVAGEADPEAGLGRIIETEAHHIFDVTRDRLFRATLVRCGPGHHVLVLVLHHLVGDGWSYGVLLRDVSDGYRASLEARTPTAAPPRLQFADYAVWQREYLREAVIAPLLAHWRRALEGLYDPVRLPGTRPAPSGSEAHILQFTIPRDLTEALRQYSRRIGTSMFVTTLAVFKVLIHRRTGDADVVVGSMAAGRTHPDLFDVIGYLGNLLVLRTDLGGEPTFAEAVDRVRRTCAAALAHADLPYALLVERLGRQRGPVEMPCFHIAFFFLGFPLTPLTLPGVSCEPLAVHPRVASRDLTMWIYDKGTHLDGMVLFLADRFDAVYVRELLAEFERLLAMAVTEPGRPVIAASPLPGRR